MCPIVDYSSNVSPGKLRKLLQFGQEASPEGENAPCSRQGYQALLEVKSAGIRWVPIGIVIFQFKT